MQYLKSSQKSSSSFGFRHIYLGSVEPDWRNLSVFRI